MSYFGSVVGESAIQNEREIGQQVIHTYQVYNNLKVQSPRLQLSVRWPYEVQSKKGSGKHLLYLVEILVRTTYIITPLFPDKNVTNFFRSSLINFLSFS